MIFFFTIRDDDGFFPMEIDCQIEAKIGRVQDRNSPNCCEGLTDWEVINIDQIRIISGEETTSFYCFTHTQSTSNSEREWTARATETIEKYWLESLEQTAMRYRERQSMRGAA